MIVSVSELRAATAILFDHLEKTGRTSVDIAEDYYWDIPAESRYNPIASPTDFTLGQLSDDITELRKLISGEVAPVGYALVWLGAVLRAAGEKNVY